MSQISLLVHGGILLVLVLTTLIFLREVKKSRVETKSETNIIIAALREISEKQAEFIKTIGDHYNAEC